MTGNLIIKFFILLFLFLLFLFFIFYISEMVVPPYSKRHYKGLIRIRRKDTLIKIIRHWLILHLFPKKGEKWLTSREIMELLKIILGETEEFLKMIGISSKRTLERDLSELSGRKGGKIKILEYKRLKRNEYCYRICPNILEKFSFKELILRAVVYKNKEIIYGYPFSIFQLFYLIETLRESNSIYEWMRENLGIYGKTLELEAGFLSKINQKKEYFRTAISYLTKEVYHHYKCNFFKLILTKPPKKASSIEEWHSKTSFDSYFLNRLKKYFKISYIIDRKGKMSFEELLKYANGMKKETVKKILRELEFFNFVRIEHNDKGEIERVQITVEGHNFCWYLIFSFAEKIIKMKDKLDRYLNLE